MDWATTHAGPQAIALCQHPELHMARHDDFMTSSQLSDKAPGSIRGQGDPMNVI